MQQCLHWIGSLPESSKQTAPINRLQEAAKLSAASGSRANRTRTQGILKDWKIPQKLHGKKRDAESVKAELKQQVLREYHRLLKRDVAMMLKQGMPGV